MDVMMLCIRIGFVHDLAYDSPVNTVLSGDISILPLATPAH